MAYAQLSFCLLSFKVLLGSPPPRCNAVAHIKLLECVQFLLLLLLQVVQGGEGEKEGGELHRSLLILKYLEWCSQLCHKNKNKNPKLFSPYAVFLNMTKCICPKRLGVFLTGQHKYLCKIPIEGLAPFSLEIPPTQRCNGVPHSWICSMCWKPVTSFLLLFFCFSLQEI